MEKEKFSTILDELAGVIQSKNTEISLLKYQVTRLEEALKEAEHHACKCKVNIEAE